MKKKNKPVKSNKKTPNKVLGQLRVLKEFKEEVVKMEVEMSDDLRDFLEQEGRKVAEENLNFFVELGLIKVIEKSFINEKSA